MLARAVLGILLFFEQIIVIRATHPYMPIARINLLPWPDHRRHQTTTALGLVSMTTTGVSVLLETRLLTSGLRHSWQEHSIRQHRGPPLLSITLIIGALRRLGVFGSSVMCGFCFRAVQFPHTRPYSIIHQARN